MIIAVDFDGTCVEHMFPDVGPDVPHAVDTLKILVASGHELIIWTMRDHQRGVLQAAERWYAERGIPYIGANRNPRQDWTQSPKAYAQMYIDDAALGCPLIPGTVSARPMVDWLAVRILFGM